MEGGSGGAAGGLSRVWTALLQQRSWLSHLRAKIFSQEPAAEAALKGAQHGTSTSGEGIKGRAPLPCRHTSAKFEDEFKSTNPSEQNTMMEEMEQPEAVNAALLEFARAAVGSEKRGWLPFVS